MFVYRVCWYCVCAQMNLFDLFINLCIYIYNHSFVCRCLLFGIVYVCMHNDVYIYIHTYMELWWWSYMPPHSLRAYSMWACSVNCALCHSQINFDPSFSVTDMGGTQHENLYVKPFYVLLWINMDKPYPNIIGIADISTSGFFLEWFLPVRWRPTAAG